MKRIVFIIITCAFSFVVRAQQTEVQYLSGTGLGDEKIWKFYCTEGNNSKKRSNIKVPSQWELQGFGEYTYGRWYKTKEKRVSTEEGFYEYTFKVPATWKDKTVTIVFEGVMTDTEVKINERSAGDIHRGGFYRFGYDITDKLDFGKNNKLEVKVSKHSENRSVNGAERMADWWLFGGIYRPVYLEAKPRVHIDRIAVNAKADGELTTELFTTSLPENYAVSASISPVKGNAVFETQTVKLKPGTERQTIRNNWKNVKNWNVETPDLYCLKLELKNEKNEVVHIHNERIGFRTIEFRPQDGIYVNNVKIVMKGINRHSFHPDGGRTTNRALSLQDAELIKAMNMNAVRSHYPPDKHFLEICDSIGLFYVNELAGWQTAYDTKVGTKLVKEMIDRDVNHPCIVLWSNGNEGGWNYGLDRLFYDYDPQKRHVIHAWADYDNLDTHHYPAYQTGIARFNNGYKVFLPAEFMHGMYDEGHGAGLEDFWKKWKESPLFAGGFMWVFGDEAVRRTDKNGMFDSDGSNAPDGIVGPYREKEASFYTVREVWSPVRLKNAMITPSFKGDLIVANDFLQTNLNECSMKYRLYSIGSPLNEAEQKLMEEGTAKMPNVEPQLSGKIQIPVSDQFFTADVLELEAFDKEGRSICIWTLPIHLAEKYTVKQMQSVQQNGKADYRLEGNTAVLSATGTKISFDISNGLLIDIENKTGKVSFGNGPIAVGMKTRFKEYKIRRENGNAVLTFFYSGGVDSIRWEMTPSGLLNMSAVMLNRGERSSGFDDSFMEESIPVLGLTFSYPEENVKGMEWYGRGPYRVWKNRIKGTNYGLWNKEYNNTITGESFDNLIYPEFKGYHANLYWATLQTSESNFSIYSESDGVFFRVFTPEEPKNKAEGMWKSIPVFPEGDISFLYEIPAIRSFKPIHHQGPQSQPGSVRIKGGDDGIKMNLWFDFR